MFVTADREVTDLAFASGFGSLSRFHAAFSAEFGRSPQQLRGEVG